MDLSEVIEFADDYYVYVNRLLDQLNNVKLKINSVINMDSFKGESADKAKECLNSFHIEMLGNFENLMIDLLDNVDNHISEFLAEVDSSEDAIIKSNYLDEQDDLIQEEFMNFSRLSSEVKQTINGVSDISSVTPPSFSDAVDEKAQVAKTIIDLDSDLTSFVSTGKDRINSIGDLLSNINSLLNDSKNQSAEGELQISKFVLNNTLAISTGFNTLGQSRTLYSGGKVRNANNNGILTTEKAVDHRRNTTSYRVKANKEALEALGVEPGYQARSQLNHRLPKGGKAWNDAHYERAYNNQAILRAADKQGKTNWTTTGQRALDMHPEIKYWKDEIDLKHVGSSTAKGFGTGLVSGFKDPATLLKDTVNVKDTFKTKIGGLSFLSKSMGAAGMGLNYYSNYNDAVEDGLSGTEANLRATQDTAIDTAVGGAVQTAFTAAGTAAIPIPGVGTIVGAGLGIAANWFLNKKWGGDDKKEGKSIMDKVKGWFH